MSEKRIFVDSVSDLFHEDWPDGAIGPVARVMTRANWRTDHVRT